MNILYVIPELNVSEGHGGSTHALETINSLEKLGYNVLIIQKKIKKQNLIERKNKKTYYNIPLIFKSGFLKQINLVMCTTLISIYLLLTKKINVVWERARIFSGLTIIFGKKLKKKTILEMNEPSLSIPLITKKINKNSIKFKIIKKMFFSAVKNADIITVTHKNMIKELPLKYKKKTIMIWYGANPKTFNPKVDGSEIIKKYNLKKGKTILYNGSFREWHALEEIIKAAEKIIKEDNEIKFLFLGNGPEFKKIKNIIKEKKLSKNIILTGIIDLKNMPKFIAASDICLDLFKKNYVVFKKLNYFYSAIKLHEHKAMGKPIIASDFGNLKELVKNKINGFRVNEEKPNEIIKAIKKLIKSKELRNKISKINREEAIKKYNWDKVTKMIVNNLKTKTKNNVKK